MRGVIFFLFLSLLSVQAHAGEPRAFSGPVHVEDGDTWFYGWSKRTHIRPAGIDAPEKAQKCMKDGLPWYAGWEAGRWLTTFLDGKEVICKTDGTKSYNRYIATCTVGGENLEEIIVRAGWAFDYPKYSNGKYTDAEAEAQAARRGVHAGQCEKPWDWRARQRSASEVPSLSKPVEVAQKCCKVCRKGKACGNSCINRSYTCHQPPGCACDAQ